MDGRFVIAPFAFADLYVLRRNIGKSRDLSLDLSSDLLQSSFRGDFGATWRCFRADATRGSLLLGLGALSVLDAVRCCTEG